MRCFMSERQGVPRSGSLAALVLSERQRTRRVSLDMLREKIAGAILLVISVLILVYAAVTRSRYTPYESEEETKIFLYGDVPGVKQY